MDLLSFSADLEAQADQLVSHYQYITLLQLYCQSVAETWQQQFGLQGRRTEASNILNNCSLCGWKLYVPAG